MSTTIFRLNQTQKTLSPLRYKSMDECKFTEPYDLETWMASTNDLFNRNILWIARQDYPSDDQRSDLIGIAQNGDLIVAELKKGTIPEGAVTQVISYAAEYSRKSAEELIQLFFEHSKKPNVNGLLQKSEDIDEARAKIQKHVGEGVEINENQIIVLFGEDYSPKTLSICEYLNNSSGDASFLFECWRYGLIEAEKDTLLFLVEQILPATSIRQFIEEKREAAKQSKYARDPKRMDFVRNLMNYLLENTLNVNRKPGESYNFMIGDKAASPDMLYQFTFPAWCKSPRIIMDKDSEFIGDAKECGISLNEIGNGHMALEFSDITIDNAIFEPGFGDRVKKAVLWIKKTPTVVTSTEPLESVSKDVERLMEIKDENKGNKPPLNNV